MLRVFATTAMTIIGSLIVAYGLSETQFSDALAFLLPSVITIAAFVNGLAIAMRTTFMKASLGLSISSERPIFGIAFVLILFSFLLATMYFLFNISEIRQQDKLSGQEL